jgi:hypothetical protein
MRKSTINYNNPMYIWLHRGWFRGKEPEASRIDRYLQNYERSAAVIRHAAYSFDHAWPRTNDSQQFPELREEFRRLFERFWKEPV